MSSTSTSLQSFFERNKLAILLGVATVIVGGGIIFLGSPPTDASKKQNKPKKSSKEKSVKRLSHGFPTTRKGADAPLFPVIDDLSKLDALSEKERKEVADEFKEAGNYAFNHKQPKNALELYEKAIQVYPKEAVYYSNRAAVHGSQQDYESVLRDTTEALRLQPDYLKCYGRRGAAHEQLGNYREAALDFTTVCILSRFEDMGFTRAVDRVLKLQAEKDAEEKFGKNNLSHELPSPSFITAYLQSFHKRELPEDVKTAKEGTGEFDLKLAFEEMGKENIESYKRAIELIDSARTKKFSSNEAEALAYEFAGTFKFLMNDAEGAIADINQSINIHSTAQAVIKRSTVNVELGKLEEAQADFKKASELDPQSADVHYQLAQVSFLQQDWNTAITHYNKAIELDPSFLLAHIQFAVTKYRLGHTEVAKRKFQNLIERFPGNSNIHNYYGEILLDMREVKAATEEFDKAIAIEGCKNTASMNVLPLLNKALALVQNNGDISGPKQALELCRKAVAIDPNSDVAIGTLAQLCLQNGMTQEAIELFEKNAKIARSMPERIQALIFAEASRCHERLPLERPIVKTMDVFTNMH